MTLLEKPLGDLRRELTDLHRRNSLQDYDMNKLNQILTLSRDSLKETGTYQQQLLQQLEQFETSLVDINQILRANIEQKVQLEQQRQTDNDAEIRAKLMALNAEALECRAAAVQLQQEAQMALAKAAEMEKRANEELAQQALEMKAKEKEIERNRAAELERRVRLEEERQRSKELQLQQQEEERRLSLARTKPTQENDYINWPVRDFMHGDQSPQCIIRSAPDAFSMPIDVTFAQVSETENLLDNQEELISTPLRVKFDPTGNVQQAILLSIPYIVKRSTHRENVIKIRQPNGLWISTETNESNFDSHKEKRFVECKLTESASCAVVSRLKRDVIFIDRKSSGRFASSADPRLTIQWPKHVCQRDFQLNLRLQPVDLPIFTQFSQNFSHECRGLLAVGPIIDLHSDDVTLLQSIQFTLPILVQAKNKVTSARTTLAESSNLPVSTVPPTQQEIIFQQQQSIFKSMLGEDSSNERLVLLFSGQNDNTWHIDPNVRLIDSKKHDIITTNMQYLYNRMIIARCDKRLMSNKQLPATISLLEQSLNQRSVSVVLRRRLSTPNEICLVCCSSQRVESINDDLEQENYTNDDEQTKELTLQEGQLLELRFRGNVLPNEHQQQSYPFAFNTYFPFYFQTNVSEADKYSQHFSPFFYGFVQIFSKQKVLKTITKDQDKKKTSTETVKQEWQETDVCLTELAIRLPKPRDDTRVSTPKTPTSFNGEGLLTPNMFRDISASLLGDEWRWLARRLGMTRIRIEAIDHDYHDDAAYHMLLAWFKRVPRSTDKISLLIHGLMNINRWDLAQDLQSMRDDNRQEERISSKDDQLRVFRVPFNRICQRDECIRVWKQIARELTVTNDIIDRIDEKYSSKQERCLRSLEHWALNSTRPDISFLARTIRTLGFKTLAREIDVMA